MLGKKKRTVKAKRGEKVEEKRDRQKTEVRRGVNKLRKHNVF